MEPGEEVTDFYFINTPNAEEHWFYRVNIRMRAGSHHMINNMMDADRADGFSGTGDIVDPHDQLGHYLGPLVHDNYFSNNTKLFLKNF